MEHMINLVYDQKLLLAAYQLFYGERYTAECKEKAMQMVYLLQLAHVDIGGFDFSLNQYPYSPGLLFLLRQLDRKENDIYLFYNDTTNKEIIIGKYRNVIIQIRGFLSILEHISDSLSWVTLLSTMAYTSRSLLPGLGFDIVCKRVKDQINTTFDEASMRTAWSALCNAKLLLIP